MAVTVDELKILINAETQGLRNELKKVNSSLGRTEKKVGKVGLGFGRLVKIMGALGLARVAGAVVRTSRTFEDLEATLRAITGSAESAAVSMDLVRKFTSGTTFQLENVAQAFITLLNAGITPTTDVLKDFGNIAAAFNKDITQIAQATFNATTGETEMLKQFGIKAKLQGDKITMIFREQETEIGRSSKEIVGYLRNLAQENFDTALEERLSTVSGAFSNLGDVVSELFNAIGEGGLNEILVESGLKLIDWGAKGQDAARVFGAVLKIAFDKLKTAIQFVTNNMRQLLAVVTIFMAAQFATFIINTALAFNSLRKQIGLTKIAMMAFNKVSKGNVVMMLGIAVLSLTGGMELLGEKVQEMISIIGDKLGGVFEGVGDDVDDTKDSVEELNAELTRIAASLSSDIPSSTSATGDALGDMRNAVIESSSAFTKDFADSLINAENALDAFKNFAKNIVSQIIAIFLQMAIVNKILNHVFGLTGTNALPTMFNAPAAVAVPPTASGGTVQAGMPALVGERGAEIFVPNTSGKVLNNMNSNNALGGGGIVINQSLNFSTGIIPTVRTEIIKMLPQIAEITKASVFDAATRGGQYGKALRGAI